jgi:signal transduction histidine kinase
MSNLQLLNEAFEKLAEAKNLDDLIKRAVTALCKQLGFDRAGILFYDPVTHEQVGTWGTDAKGKLRNERDFRAPVDDHLIKRHSEERVRVSYDATLQELGESVDSGWHIQAAIFSGEDLFGWLFVDNLINKKELPDDQLDLIRAFSNVLGQLIVRSKIEDTLIDALDSLATNEDLTMTALDKVNRLEGQIAGNRKMLLLAERLSGLVPMSARSVGNLLNFVALLSPKKFDEADQALLESAKKSADQLSRIYRHFDQKVHEATDNDIQLLPAAVVQEYWTNQFSPLFRATPHHFEVKSDSPTQEITLPLILLTQLVKELVINSIMHGLESCESGRTLVTLKQTEQWLTVTVEDTGPGLDEDQYRDVLKLFVTSKPNELLGSGLNVTQHYVERWLNGQLDLSASKLGGLCCTLNIPISTEPLS